MALPIKGSAEGAWEAIQGLKATSARRPAQTAADLDRIFRAGAPPQGLNGRHEGILVMTTQGPLDGLSRRLASLWMPWLGKRFDRQAATGDNLLTQGASTAARFVWRRYAFRPVEPGVLSAFDFRTYTAAGLVDSDRLVLKIDYDLDSNPRFLIRSILDELVAVGPMTYLGKVHMKRGRDWKMMGYFALRPDPLQPQDEFAIWDSAEVTQEPTPAPRRRKSRKRSAETG
ncbi:MAG TPA: hypothetical protein VIK45_05535 [Candidatus Dormibacteraeota bacterium]|jgi:hypothetical protein